VPLAIVGIDDPNAFHFFGFALAICAVVVTFLGITRDGFPGDRRGELVVIAVFALLVVATIVSAVVTAGHEEEHGEGEHRPEGAALVAPT
jgi:hypothetical protein